ncbi:MAG: efflux RND transporter periplasmic adaptor subunit, partial [Magnetococcales bacterium]|nr:efflux RND transporter periplasmic adaptor subunit [Magnetococcales bacterium]
LTPRYQAVISAEIAGKITILNFREGERFQNGKKLAEIKCAQHKARYDKANAELTITIRQHQANLRLMELKSIGSHEVDIAQANVSKARADVAFWKDVKTKCVIIAPFSGRVAKLHVHEHEYVAEGDKLMKIVDDHNLEIELLVPSDWQTWLKPGLGFNINIDETSKDYPAEVSMTGAQIDPVSQSFKVIGKIKGHFPELLPGMSGSVIFLDR